jgi:5-oxoprolinase (ATP-hydrolysing)
MIRIRIFLPFLLLILLFTVLSSRPCSAFAFATSSSSSIMTGDGKFHFAIDRGGTFTDVVCRLPDGTEVVTKLLSEDPQHYEDAPTEGIRRLLATHDASTGIDCKYPRGAPVTTTNIGSIRMGTTVATNALLERQGSKMAWITTKGFKDLLEIGNQARPDIFDLTCATPSLLYQRVVEVDERVILEQHYTGDTTNFPKEVGVTKETLLIEKVPDLEIVKKELETLQDAFLHAGRQLGKEHELF